MNVNKIKHITVSNKFHDMANIAWFLKQYFFTLGIYTAANENGHPVGGHFRSYRT